jgi:hypothetical protein
MGRLRAGGRIAWESDNLRTVVTIVNCDRYFKGGNGVATTQTAKPLKHRGPAEMPPIPESLNTPEFVAAWETWRRYRATDQKAHSPVTPLMAQMQFRRFGRIGPAAAVLAIERAVANGWQGIVMEVEKGEKGMAAPPVRDLAAEAKALMELGDD